MLDIAPKWPVWGILGICPTTSRLRPSGHAAYGITWVPAHAPAALALICLSCIWWSALRMRVVPKLSLGTAEGPHPENRRMCLGWVAGLPRGVVAPRHWIPTAPAIACRSSVHRDNPPRGTSFEPSGTHPAG